MQGTSEASTCASVVTPCLLTQEMQGSAGMSTTSTLPFYQPPDGNPGLPPHHFTPSSGRASLGGTHYL